MQAQTVLRRVRTAEKLWDELSQALAETKLPERAAWALFDAASGLRVRRAAYARDAELESPTAARDLRMLAAAGLLNAVGETKARVYVATPRLREMRVRAGQEYGSVVNPYDGPADRPR